MLLVPLESSLKITILQLNGSPVDTQFMKSQRGIALS